MVRIKWQDKLARIAHVDRGILPNAVPGMLLPMGKHFHLRTVLLPSDRPKCELRFHFSDRRFPRALQLAWILIGSIPLQLSTMEPQGHYSSRWRSLVGRCLPFELYCDSGSLS